MAGKGRHESRDFLAWESGQMVMLYTGQYEEIRNLRIDKSFSEYEALAVHLG